MTFLEEIEAALVPGFEAALTTYLTGGNKDAIEAAGRAAVVKTAANSVVQAIAASQAAATQPASTQNLTITDNTGTEPKQV